MINKYPQKRTHKLLGQSMKPFVGFRGLLSGLNLPAISNRRFVGECRDTEILGVLGCYHTAVLPVQDCLAMIFLVFLGK